MDLIKWSVFFGHSSSNFKWIDAFSLEIGCILTENWIFPLLSYTAVFAENYKPPVELMNECRLFLAYSISDTTLSIFLAVLYFFHALIFILFISIISLPKHYRELHENELTSTHYQQSQQNNSIVAFEFFQLYAIFALILNISVVEFTFQWIQIQTHRAHKMHTSVSGQRSSHTNLFRSISPFNNHTHTTHVYGHIITSVRERKKGDDSENRMDTDEEASIIEQTDWKAESSMNCCSCGFAYRKVTAFLFDSKLE